MQENESRKYYRISTYLSVITNLMLIIGKFAIGIISSSAALITDAVHSLSDIFTDIVIYIALIVSLKKPDEGHPYGHGKIENLVSVMVGVILAVVGFSFGYDGIKRLIQNEIPVLKNNWPIYVALASVVSKEVLFWITLRYGKKTKSDALIANAWHHRSDAFSSVVALVGIGASLLGFKYGDVLASVAIAIILIVIGVRIFIENSNVLIEASAPKELYEIVCEIMESIPEIKKHSNLRMRRVGNKIYGEVNIWVEAAIPLKDAHHIAVKLKKEAFIKVEGLADIVVHIDPFEL